jgi:hypothetical protein
MYLTVTCNTTMHTQSVVVFIATMVKQTRHNVMLYSHCISCLYLVVSLFPVTDLPCYCPALSTNILQLLSKQAIQPCTVTVLRPIGTGVLCGFTLLSAPAVLHLQQCLYNYALQPLRLIVRSGLDVPTFATRRLHACHHARAPSGGRWNCGREMSGNFA